MSITLDQVVAGILYSIDQDIPSYKINNGFSDFIITQNSLLNFDETEVSFNSEQVPVQLLVRKNGSVMIVNDPVNFTITEIAS